MPRLSLLRSRALSGSRHGALPVALLLCSVVALLSGPCAAQEVWRLEPGRILDARIQAGLPPQPTWSKLSPEQLRAVKVDPEVAAYVAQLGDASFTVREQATRRLIEIVEDRVQLYAVLQRESLTPEQRYRVLAVARDSLLRTQRGALGVEMQPFAVAMNQPARIKVSNLVPRLPAERVLQIDDIITHIDDRPVMRVEDLQDLVQSKQPGEKVTLAIERERRDERGERVRNETGDVVRERLTIEIELGSAELLRDRNGEDAPSRVALARRAEAGAVSIAYAPAPRPVNIRGGTERLSHADPIDQHPVILNLMQQRQLVAEGNRRESDLRVAWERDLRSLMELAGQPGISAEDRDVLRRVITRYIELMGG